MKCDLVTNTYPVEILEEDEPDIHELLDGEDSNYKQIDLEMKENTQLACYINTEDYMTNKMNQSNIYKGFNIALNEN